jgi:hypothetical protein
MKPPRHFIPLFFAPSFFCHSQNTRPTAKSTRLAALARVEHSPAAREDPDSFVFGASDVLAFTVWGHPTLSDAIFVRSGVMITSLLVGHTQASEMTPHFASGDTYCRAPKPRGVVCSAIAN